MSDDSAQHPVGRIVDRISDVAEGDGMCVRDLVAAFGQRSFLPVLMAPALLVLSPLSGIPLFSSTCGVIIAFISAQMLAQRRYLWLPGFLMRRRIDGPRTRRAVARLHKLADWLDNHSRGRLRPMLRPPMRMVVHLVCLCCGLAMPFLELVPFSSSILGGAVLLLATALMVGDGVFALLGILVAGLALSIPLAALGNL